MTDLEAIIKLLTEDGWRIHTSGVRDGVKLLAMRGFVGTLELRSHKFRSDGTAYPATYKKYSNICKPQ